MSILPIGLSPGITGNKKDLDAVQREIENARKRLAVIGQQDLAQPKYQHSPLTRALETVLRPSYGSMNMIKEAMFKDERPGGAFNPLAAFGRGFSLQKKTIGKDIMRKLGVSEEPLFEAHLFKDRLRIAPSKAGIAGFAADVLNPLDPLNWLTFGVGKAGLTAGRSGMELLPKAFGTESSIRIADLLGNPKLLDDVTGRTVDDVATQISSIAQKHAPDKKNEIMQEVHRGMLGMNTTTRTKIPGVSDKMAIKTRMTVPFTNKHLTDVAIPGSHHLVRAITSMGERASKTGIGDKLGRSFSTKYTPQTVPGSVFLRVLSGDIKPGDKLWENTVERLAHELHFSSGPKEYQRFKEGVHQVFERARKDEDQWRLNVEFIFKDLTIRDKKDVMRYAAENLPYDQIPKHLQPAYRSFQGWKQGIVKEYLDMGIPVKELDNYVPHVVVGGRLSKKEAKLLTDIFGQSSKQSLKKGENPIWDVAISGDPHLKDKKFHATPEEINKVLGREWLTEDAAIAMSMRGARFLKAKELVVFLRGSIEKYGLTIADVNKIKGGVQLPKSIGERDLKEILARSGVDAEALMAHRNLPTGYAFYQVRTNSGGRISLEPVNDLTDAKGVFAFPEEFGRAFNDYVNLHFDPTAGNAIERLVDRFTAGFRMVAYMWNPGHIPRDAYSNVALSWLAGLRDPRVYGQAMKLYKPLEHQGAKEHSMFVKALEREASGEELFEKARGLGVVDTGQALGETPMSIRAALGGREAWNPLKYSDAYTKLMIDSTRMVDNYTRFSLFIDGLNKGMTLEQSAIRVKKFLFDYFDLTPFERKWMRRVIPFYTWLRKNIPLQVEQLMKQPGKLATFGKYHRAMSEDDEWVDPEKSPSWAQKGMAINLPGGMSMMSNLPYADLAHLPVSKETGRQFMSNINPLFRYLPEVFFGQESFSGMPLEWYPGEKTDIPIAGALAHRAGIDLPKIPRRTVGHAAYQIPFVRNLDTMLDPEGSERSFARLMSFLGGPPFYSDERLEESQTYEERDRLRAVIRMLIDAGYEVPDTRELNRMLGG